MVFCINPKKILMPLLHQQSMTSKRLHSTIAPIQHPPIFSSHLVPIVLVFPSFIVIIHLF